MSGFGVFILPDEVQAEIFIRLPVKSIGKSRCVSKQWHSLLNSPRFIKAHLARSRSHKSMLISNWKSVFTSTLHGDHVAAESIFKDLDGIPLPRLQITMVAGPCHGLILIVIGQIRCTILMNPTTLENCKLPKSPDFALYYLRRRIGYSLGYDSSSDDYKVVALTSYETDNKLFTIFADIYSLKMNTWKRTDHYGPFVRLMSSDEFGHGEVFVNGALHWILPKKNFNSEKAICALDLGTEKFHEILYLGSHSLQEGNYFQDRLISIKGCLGIAVVDKSHARVDIWTMNKYGIADSLTKTVFNVGEFSCIPSYLRVRDALVIRLQHYSDSESYPYVMKLMFYCFNDEKCLYLTVDTRKNNNLFYCGRIGGFIYSESLVSPHRLNTQQQEEEEEEECLHVRKKS